MEFTKKAQNLKKGLNRFFHRFRERGRRVCAVLLCASMVISGFPGSFFQAFASDGDEEFYYEIEREALYEAVCTAVSEGTTVDRELDFTGEYADQYAELFDADGTLYELKDLEVEKDRDRDKVLDLRVFVRIEGDIPLDGYYDIDGEESVIFLLTNRSKDATSAVIYVDDLETETIEIVSAASVSRDGGPGSRSVAETALKAAESETNDKSATEIGAEGMAESAEGEEAVEDAEGDSEISIDDQAEDASAEADDEAGQEDGENADAEADADGSDKDTDTGDSESSDDAGSASDPSDSSSGNSSSDDSSDDGKDASDSGDNSEGRDHSAKGDHSDRNDDTEKGDRSDRSDKDHSEKENNSKDRGFSGGKVKSDNSRDHSGSSSDSKSGSGSDGKSSSDSGSDKSEKSASVSLKRVGLLGASVTEDIAIEEENGEQGDEAGETSSADDIIITSDGDIDDIVITIEDGDDGIVITTDSEVIITSDSEITIASSSDADEEDSSDNNSGDTINGELYDAVILDAKKAAVAFVTTAEDLGLVRHGEVTYTAEDGGIEVTVTADNAVIPSGAELVVTRYEENSEDYDIAAYAINLDEMIDEYAVSTLNIDTDDENAEETETKTEIGMAAFDISFIKNGKEVEPRGPVTVSIDISEILPDDVDISNIEVQHLVEDGTDVEAVVVASTINDAEGDVDIENGVIEFEVDSFSSFTITWSWSAGGTGTNTASLTVTAYLDGTEIDGINNVTFTSENDELDFETLLSEVGYGTGDYTFSYAIGTIGNVTYGSEGDPIVAIEITMGSTGGPGTTNYFRIVYIDGSYVDVATSSSLTIVAYYTTPSLTVEIIAVDEDKAEDWELRAVVAHQTEGSTLSYEWWITDTEGEETSLAHVANTDNTGEAFIVWDEDVQDNDEVVVHVRVTETHSNGTTETAEASYTLEYGDETVDLIMTYGPNQTALPAGVTVTLTNEATGESKEFTTSDDGWVHDAEIEPGIYIVSATYTVNGSTYQCNEEIALHDAGNYSINLDYYNPDILTSVPDKDDWEHIDIKLSIGTSGSASSEDVTLNITSATIYTSTGEVRATTTEVTGTDNEFQLHWSTGSGNTHSTSFSSTDYIVINYTLTENGVTTEYSITIGPDTVYSAGTTYPATGQRAYKLYNYLYGTSFESDAQLVAAGIDEIDISGMSLYLVGAILCDSSEVTGAGQLDVSSVQAGIDFALSIDAINELATSWQFEIEKTYYNASMLAGNFAFVLYDATADGDTWTQGSAYSTLTNSQAGIGQSGYSQDTMDSLAIAYSDEDIQNNATYYYILSETPNTITSSSGAEITFDETVFGIKVQLGTEGEGNDATATVTVTYYTLTGSDGTYTAQEYDGDKINIDNSTGEPTFKFENTYQEYVTISGTKVWDDNNNAAGKRPSSITINLLKNGSAALDDEGNPITLTVNGEGDSWNWSFENLPVWDGITKNVYSIEEITVDGYIVNITQNEDTGEYTITNSYNYFVNVYKYDSTTNEPLEYVTFMLWLISDDEEEAFADFTYDEETGVNTVSAWIPAGTPLGNYNYQIITDEEGYIHIAGLEPGDYWLEEQDPLQGYKRIEEPISFTINEDGTITSEYWSEDADALAIPNDEEIINVRKTDSNGNPLEDAEFVAGWVLQPTQAISTQVEGTNYYYDYLTFTKDSDTDSSTYVFIPNGQVDTRDEATTLTTGEDGYIYLRELDTGILYFLVETKAPDGYELLEDPIVFGVDYDGNMTLYLPSDDEHVSADGDTITVVDDAETFDVLIYKYVDDGYEEPGQVISYRPKADSPETYAASYYSALAGAEFSLSRETDDGIEYAVANRILNNNLYSYTITEWTEDKDEATTLLSDIDGYLEITNLPAGTYTLTETKAPDGYQLLTEAIVFEVASDGNVSVVSGPADIDSNSDGSTWITIANEEITGEFELDKTDENGNALSGAEFILGAYAEYSVQVLGTDAETYAVTSDGQYEYYYFKLDYDEESGSYLWNDDYWYDTRNEATVMTTGTDGKLRISNLMTSSMLGATYFLIETKAPDGYALLTEPIVFTVNDDGTIKLVDGSNDETHVSVSTDDDGTEVITVINEAGYELPSAGGSGTLPFRIVGAFLSGSALWLLFLTLRRRRRWLES